MSILKYILFALVLLGLWVTEPLWMNSDPDTATAPVDEHITKQNKAKDEVVNVEARFLKKLEIKYGPKPSVKDGTGVPASVYTYWRKTLQYPDSLQEETCGPIRGSEEGWTTVCRYRIKNSSYELELREDRFVIRNGNAYKK